MERDERDSREPAPGPAASPPEPPLPFLGLFDRVNNYFLLLYAAACLFMNYAISGMLYLKGLVALSLSLPGIISILIPFFFLSRRSPYGFSGEFSFGRLDLRTAAVVFIVAASAILPVEAFSGLFERLWKPNANYTSFILSIKPKGPLSFAAIAFGTVVVAPLAEELLFRGFVQRIFQRNMSGPLAVALAGVLFAVSHFNPPVIAGVTALGILYGYLFYRTGSLWCPIAGHAIYNFVTLVRLNASTEEEIVAARIETPDVTLTLASLAVFIVGVWLLERRRRTAGQ
jgi:membrane protease YdiL (CAAX protease family)